MISTRTLQLRLLLCRLLLDVSELVLNILNFFSKGWQELYRNFIKRGVALELLSMSSLKLVNMHLYTLVQIVFFYEQSLVQIVILQK
jgi:hypothetical protein